MVRLLSFFVSVACATAVVASYEPLEANNLFARDVSYEPLDAPSATRRDGSFRQHLPRTHGLVARGYNSHHAAALSSDLMTLNKAVKTQHATIVSFCHTVTPQTPPSTCTHHLTPPLTSCGHHIHHHCGTIPNIPTKPHPSAPAGGSGGSPPSCAGLLAELIELIEEIIAELEGLVKKIPILGSFVEGYIQQLDAELSTLVHASNTVVPEVQSYVSKFVSNLEGDLKKHGFGSLLSELKL